MLKQIKHSAQHFLDLAAEANSAMQTKQLSTLFRQVAHKLVPSANDKTSFMKIVEL